MKLTLRLKGGKGSGNFNHKGRPGLVGGSSPAGRGVIDDYLNMVSKISSNSKESIIKKYGRYYEPQALPKEYKKKANKECFKNAYELASSNSSLKYVEGYAVPDFIDLPIEHAWCIDKDGKVIDNTWKTPGVAYYGIEFDLDFVRQVILETKTYGAIKMHSKVFRDKYSKDVNKNND